MPAYDEEEYSPAGARRALVYLYADDRESRHVVVDGLTTDRNLRRLYEVATETEADAWVLQSEDLLPSWWRLVFEVRAEYLSDSRDLVTWPQADAAQRRMGLAPAQVRYEVDGWRVQRTRHGDGRIVKNVKVRETRTAGSATLGPPDTRIRHAEAFAAEPSRARINAVREADPPITRWVVDMDKVTVHVVGDYVLIPTGARAHR